MTQAFYKNVLESFRLNVGPDDLISFAAPGEPVEPAQVEGRRLVLPSPARLAEGFTDKLQPFHPFSENIARGVSPVLNHLQKTGKILIIYYVIELARALVQVASKPELHSDLPPDFADFLLKVSKADESTVKDLNTLLRAAMGKHNSIISLFLKNGGVYEGKKVRRLCVVRFPILEELAKCRDSGEKPYGAKISNKNIAVIEAVFRKIVPMGDDPEQYSAGTNGQFAPYFESFLLAWTKVITQLNKVIRFVKPLETELVPIKHAYEADLKDLGKYYNQIVPLRGNEGELPKNPEAQAEEDQSLPWNGPATPTDSVLGSPLNQPFTATPAPHAPANPGYTAPPPAAAPIQHQQHQASKPAAGTVSAADFLNSMRPQQPTYQGVQQPSYMQPNQPAYPQPPANPFLAGLMLNRNGGQGGQGGGGVL